jgi:uncharacterized membrane protein
VVTVRWLRHLVEGPLARRRFPPESLDRIQAAIKRAERTHLGEVCVAIEGRLDWGHLLRGRTPRERAQEVFTHLRVWDTAHNTGVLVYLLLADHAIEIVADRAVAAKVDQAEWDRVCATMRAKFVAGDYERGAEAGVEAVAEILGRHFPSDGKENPDELPDRPRMI